MFELEWLEVLNLSFNQLTTLPKAIARLQQLTSLDLSCQHCHSSHQGLHRWLKIW
ncbi:leucine-rich repeat domain-containing protein [Nostoc sp.]|uniref:leucine-rich repeat domain-containing protein n=1 Tax=Nostoc sp. TaxID=1180 RepID=UPI003FA5E63A